MVNSTARDSSGNGLIEWDFYTMKNKTISVLIFSAIAWGAGAETIGDVSTTFKLLSPNDKIVVGLAEDTSDAAVACRQVGPISFSGKIPEQDEVFNTRSSFLFKHVRVVRMVDKKRNTLVYLVYSDKLVDGSPKNNLTAVAVPENQPIPLK